jgi:predicted metal-dependent hydrolase
VLLPIELCDAVIVHELAHTEVMDHSTRFWSFLESLDPDARVHRARLKNAASLIPAWADA